MLFAQPSVEPSRVPFGYEAFGHSVVVGSTRRHARALSPFRQAGERRGPGKARADEVGLVQPGG